MRIDWLADVLRDAGLTVTEYPGWPTRGNDSVFNRFAPFVVVDHHTATGTNWTNQAVADLLAVKGNKTTPAPLCNVGLRRDGVYVCIASGIANHAGPGYWKGATANKQAVGIEAYNNGLGEPWPPVQLEAYARGNAAILKQLGRDASFVAAHREWRPKAIGKFGAKIDPFGINMAAMRLKVQAILEDDDMTTTQARIEVAAAWHSVSGDWMTATATETAQTRLTRLAGEVVAKIRTAAQIAIWAPPRDSPIDPYEAVPAWVVDPTIP